MYSDEERGVFKYFNGEKEVYADPLTLNRQILIATAGQPSALTQKVFIDVAKATPEEILESCQATEKLVAVIRHVFQMKPLNTETGAGAMDSHCLMAWRELATYLSKKNRSSVNSPTASASMVGLPA
jgi:hypothetical protein